MVASPDGRVTAMEKICPRCGRRSSEVEFIGRLCKDCYVEVYSVAKVPEHLHYVFCRYCGRYKYQGGWNEPSGTLEETLKDFIHLVVTKKAKPTRDIEEIWVEDVHLDRPLTGPGIYTATVRIAGRSGDVVVREDRVIKVKVDVGVCPDCTNKLTKRGYNAIVQIRSSEGRLSEDLRRRVERFINKDLSTVLRATIIGTEEHKEGFDLLVNEPSSARMIASKIRQAFMGKTVETWKLVGRKSDGSRKGRLTILVRLPDIDVGEVIDVGGHPYLYLAQSRAGSPLMLDLETGREVSLKPDTLWDRGFRKRDTGPETRRLILLARTGRKVIFLDEDLGYEKVEIPKEKVRVLIDNFEQGGVYEVLMVKGRAYVMRRIR